MSRNLHVYDRLLTAQRECISNCYVEWSIRGERDGSEARIIRGRNKDYEDSYDSVCRRTFSPRILGEPTLNELRPRKPYSVSTSDKSNSSEKRGLASQRLTAGKNDKRLENWDVLNQDEAYSKEITVPARP